MSIVERNGVLTSTVEATTNQLNEHMDTVMILNNEADNLKSIIHRKVRESEEASQYMKEYDEEIEQLRQEIRDKDEIIDSFKQSDMTRLIQLNKQFTAKDSDEVSKSSASNKSENGSDNLGDLTHDPDVAEISIDYENYGLHGRMSQLISNSDRKNRDLKTDLDLTEKKYSETNQKRVVDKEKIDNLEQDVITLTSHFHTLEKEKNITEQKFKNLQFKNQALVKENGDNRHICHELEIMIEKMETEYNLLEEKLTKEIQYKNTLKHIDSDQIYQNPNLDLSRYSTTMYAQ